MKFVVICYSGSHRKLKQVSKQLTFLSCSKLGRPSGLCGRVQRQSPTLNTLSSPPMGRSHLRPSQALSGYQVKPDILSQHQTCPSFPADQERSWEDRSQGPNTTGLMGSKVPSLGVRSWRAPPARGRGAENHYKKSKDKGGVDPSKEQLGPRRSFTEKGVGGRIERERETSNLHEGKTGF